MRRKSSLAAAKRIATQFVDDAGSTIKNGAVESPSSTPSKDASLSEHESASDNDDALSIEPPAKRQKRAAPKKGASEALYKSLFDRSVVTATYPVQLPLRQHAVSYHRPLLLSGPTAREDRQSLFTWFDSVSTSRNMPWRKAWIDPADYSAQDPTALRQALERRAYEVWISEIMLQQTRVAVVIDYWNRWMAKWPVIQDLASASPDDVLSAWRGLGYYSRATRIHEAAKLVVSDPVMAGLLPENVSDLEKKVPGVGRYTAGAISAIVYGHAAPMVDGNVLRVLSRQLGVLGNIKSEKPVIDLLWAAAAALVKAAAEDAVDDGPAVDGEPPVSSRPGRWGQALMELGSTVCTPKPNCSQCPITKTCRAYAEGKELAAKANSSSLKDIEDECDLCHPFEEAADATESDPVQDQPKKASSGKQATLAAFRFTRTSNEKSAPSTAPSAKTMEVIVNHAKKFPLKVVKKAVRVEETIVCAVRHGDRLLIHRRPSKGLLAGMWEFPSLTLPDTGTRPAAREKLAKAHVMDLIASLESGGSGKVKASHVGELGSVPWLFSHLKLTMHVHLFELDNVGDLPKRSATSRWASVEEVEEESMGTGMRKCWALVKDAEDG